MVIFQCQFSFSGERYQHTSPSQLSRPTWAPTIDTHPSGTPVFSPEFLAPMDLVSNCGRLLFRPPDLFPNLLHHPVLQLDLSHLLCLGFRGHLGGGNDFSKWLMSTGGYSIAYIYIYCQAKSRPQFIPITVSYVFGAKTRKEFTIPSGWILFRLAYGVHVKKNRWNLSFSVGLSTRIQHVCDIQGQQIWPKSPRTNANRRLIIRFSILWSLWFVKSLKASKKNLCQLPKNLCIPMFGIILDDGGLKKMYQFTGFSCFPAPGNISPATWCLEDEH